MNPMIIASLTAIFAVGLIGFSMLIARESGGAVHHSSGLFKTGDPGLAGDSATLGIHEGHVEIPAALEADRQGVTPRNSEARRAS